MVLFFLNRLIIICFILFRLGYIRQLAKSICFFATEFVVFHQEYYSLDYDESVVGSKAFYYPSEAFNYDRILKKDFKNPKTKVWVNAPLNPSMTIAKIAERKVDDRAENAQLHNNNKKNFLKLFPHI